MSIIPALANELDDLYAVIFLPNVNYSRTSKRIR